MRVQFNFDPPPPPSTKPAPLIAIIPVALRPNISPPPIGPRVIAPIVPPTNTDFHLLDFNLYSSAASKFSFASSILVSVVSILLLITCKLSESNSI